ncbi:hypothetical protein EVAR_10765_1 [Eumeta japonica]|uniref:Uncharacterized protein n=1 Tax=Eumeta variegata TaxID=151549 RepID=A0A4C1W9I6_EUMVA|nr:hypothetical protein EVAR_10765_1 [Eumeta japonica]
MHYCGNAPSQMSDDGLQRLTAVRGRSCTGVLRESAKQYDVVRRLNIAKLIFERAYNTDRRNVCLVIFSERNFLRREWLTSSRYRAPRRPTRARYRQGVLN